MGDRMLTWKGEAIWGDTKVTKDFTMLMKLAQGGLYFIQGVFINDISADKITEIN